MISGSEDHVGGSRELGRMWLVLFNLFFYWGSVQETVVLEMPRVIIANRVGLLVDRLRVSPDRAVFDFSRSVGLQGIL